MKFLITTILCIILLGCKENQEVKPTLIDLTNKNKEEVIEYCSNNNINLIIEEEYSTLEEGLVFYQSIAKDTNIPNDLTIKVSKGIDYVSLKVNELGRIPIMMYHGIKDIENEYTGGNIDKSGYQRTMNAFIEDLEFYYSNGYRMIRLVDYINGIIDVEAGYSPIVLTFDDGLANNINVLGLNEDGSIIIDPKSAVGILESFKDKYPDYNVTATFFLNATLFNQSEYNDKIITWLIENGYDIGNHSYSHVDFTDVDELKTQEEIGKQYDLMSKYTSSYVNIVALPYGSPYNKTHNNFEYILNGSYNDLNYNTISTLRVGWESDYSPFSNSFDKTFIKRIRAYDNNGIDFDIEYNFKYLRDNKYISDGNADTIAVLNQNIEEVNNIYNLEVIGY